MSTLSDLPSRSVGMPVLKQSNLTAEIEEVLARQLHLPSDDFHPQVDASHTASQSKTGYRETPDLHRQESLLRREFSRSCFVPTRNDRRSSKAMMSSRQESPNLCSVNFCFGIFSGREVVCGLV